MSSKKRTSFLCVFLCICMLACGCGGSSSDSLSFRDREEGTQSAGDTDIAGSDIPKPQVIDIPSNDGVSPDGTDPAWQDVSDGESYSEDSVFEWSIYVYMCGSDLESKDGIGTIDLREMKDGTKDGRVRFVVETGGTTEWQNDFTDPRKNQRFLIENGELYMIKERSRSPMYRPETLADFVAFCRKNYPSEHTGLVFWNHGGGSITGVCFDEIEDNKSMSLAAVHMALSMAGAGKGQKLDFIGFDTCLMGTLETAYILRNFADYMYASQENESEKGWDYSDLGKYISENPGLDAKTLGIAVADIYYRACEWTEEDDAATYSVIDLSKIDLLATEFDLYSKELYGVTEDKGKLAGVVRAASEADNFGGNNRSEGYTNMVDLAGVIMAGKSRTQHGNAALAALKRCVVYTKNGKSHSGACGLSVYYPLVIGGTTELAIFGQVAVSPYYLAFVDRAAYTGANAGSSEGYDPYEIFSLWGKGYDALDDHFSYYDDDFQVTGESSYVKFAKKPALNNEGIYGFTLTEESLDNILSVTGVVYQISDDGHDILCLGETAEISQDWEQGAFTDAFDGYWFSLPDGQNLSVYLQSQTEDADIYSSPVELNGKKTNLVIVRELGSRIAYISGIRDNIDDTGMADRTDRVLKNGDRILPLYEASSLLGEKEGGYTYVGEEYTYRKSDRITFELMPDGKYLFGFIIDDLFGDYYVTDFADFEVEGKEVYYSEK